MRDALEERGHTVNRKRIQRLMRQMDLRALYPRRRTSQPGQGHKIYPYLLRDLSIERANQAWASDICYIPMAKGFMYLVAIMLAQPLREYHRAARCGGAVPFHYRKTRLGGGQSDDIHGAFDLSPPLCRSRRIEKLGGAVARRGRAISPQPPATDLLAL